MINEYSVKYTTLEESNGCSMHHFNLLQIQTTRNQKVSTYRPQKIRKNSEHEGIIRWAKGTQNRRQYTTDSSRSQDTMNEICCM